MSSLMSKCVSAMVVLIVAVCSWAQTFPLSVQGKLTGVADGQQSMALRLWDAASGGNEVASVPFVAEVSGGVFSAAVDVPVEAIVTSQTAFNDEGRWWSVQIASQETARQRIASAPFAVGTRGIRVLPDGRVNAFGFISDNFYFWSGLRYVGEPETYAITVESDTLVVTGYQLKLRGLARPAELHLGGNVFGEQIAQFSNGTKVVAPVLQITGGSDLAEPFAASADDIVDPKPGMVMSIDPDMPGSLRVASAAYDTRVAGVYSGGNGLNTGMIMGQEGCALTAAGQDKIPLAMTGRVWVYAEGSGGEIRPGDRLTTSGAKPGHAMKVKDETRSIGAVIGKAMTGVDPESGMVMVLVNLQ